MLEELLKKVTITSRFHRFIAETDYRSTSNSKSNKKRKNIQEVRYYMKIQLLYSTENIDQESRNFYHNKIERLSKTLLFLKPYQFLI